MGIGGSAPIDAARALFEGARVVAPTVMAKLPVVGEVLVALVDVATAVAGYYSACGEAHDQFKALNNDLVLLSTLQLEKCDTVITKEVVSRLESAKTRLEKMKESRYENAVKVVSELKEIKATISETVAYINLALTKRVSEDVALLVSKIDKLNPDLESLSGNDWYEKGKKEMVEGNFGVAQTCFANALLHSDSLPRPRIERAALLLKDCKARSEVPVAILCSNYPDDKQSSEDPQSTTEDNKTHTGTPDNHPGTSPFHNLDNKTSVVIHSHSDFHILQDYAEP
ncbi:hypothetical protein Pelo_819 [Pelomyxa schiedti]|nr:hypothetical protein Pelo_819 [Pelomyxa schiedti]